MPLLLKEGEMYDFYPYDPTIKFSLCKNCGSLHLYNEYDTLDQQLSEELGISGLNCLILTDICNECSSVGETGVAIFPTFNKNDQFEGILGYYICKNCFHYGKIDQKFYKSLNIERSLEFVSTQQILVIFVMSPGCSVCKKDFETKEMVIKTLYMYF